MRFIFFIFVGLVFVAVECINSDKKENSKLSLLKKLTEFGLKQLSKHGKNNENGLEKSEVLKNIVDLLKNEPKEIKKKIEKIKAKAPSAPSITNILKKVEDSKDVVKKEINNKVKKNLHQPSRSMPFTLMKKIFGLMIFG
uniref:SXP/RAL-2 family protein Ani s 5-like cation-binding domain-containing protein n=1 Tax=Strongyloides stercoralis TaxID=6248 RepID=A0A0K0E4Z7_STRER